MSIMNSKQNSSRVAWKRVYSTFSKSVVTAEHSVSHDFFFYLFLLSLALCAWGFTQFGFFATSVLNYKQQVFDSEHVLTWFGQNWTVYDVWHNLKNLLWKKVRQQQLMLEKGHIEAHNGSRLLVHRKRMPFSLGSGSPHWWSGLTRKRRFLEISQGGSTDRVDLITQFLALHAMQVGGGGKQVQLRRRSFGFDRHHMKWCIWLRLRVSRWSTMQANPTENPFVLGSQGTSQSLATVGFDNIWSSIDREVFFIQTMVMSDSEDAKQFFSVHTQIFMAHDGVWSSSQRRWAVWRCSSEARTVSRQGCLFVSRTSQESSQGIIAHVGDKALLFVLPCEPWGWSTIEVAH